MVKDEDFSHAAKVDRYGRRLATDAGKAEIKKYYDLEDSDEETSGGEEDGEKPKKYDPARGEGLIDTSDEETTTDDEAEVESEEAEDQGPEEDIPTGDVYRRLAVVNLDWDNVRAVDLMATLSSFKSKDGKVV